MLNVPPRIDGITIRVAEDQPEYIPVTVLPAINPNHAVPEHNAIIMCFAFTKEERQRVTNGENLYIAMLTGGAAQQPILLTVGPEEMAEWHGLQVKPIPLDLRLLDDLSDCAEEGGARDA